MELNKKYNIRLSVLTPISIGAGAESDWAKGVDYVQSNGKVYVLDLRKIVKAGIDINSISNLFLKGDESEIISLIGSKLEDVSKAIYASPATSSNPIKTFLRSELVNKPIVAGSSLKGAIRTVLFTHLRENETRTDEVFGSLAKGENLMRFIKVTDFEMPETKLVNTKIFNLKDEDGKWVGGWKYAAKQTNVQFSPTGFNTIYECVESGKSAFGNIMISNLGFEKLLDKGAKMPYSQEKSKILASDITDLFKIINSHTLNYLKKEKEFFETFPTEHTDQIVDSIDNLITQIPSDGSFCVLKMSAGVGFHSITGDYMHDNYVEGTFNRKVNKSSDTLPKSRKIAIDNGRFTLMGFVKLECVSNSMFESSIQAIRKSHNKSFDAVLDEINKKKLAEEEKRRAKEQLEKEYLQKIAEAKVLASNNDYESAISILQSASTLQTVLSEHVALLHEFEESLEEQTKQKREAEWAKIEAAKAQQEAENKAKKEEKYSIPFADMLVMDEYVSTNLWQWSKIEGHAIGEAEYALLVEHLKSLDKNARKKILSKRKDFEKALGKGISDKLYKEKELK